MIKDEPVTIPMDLLIEPEKAKDRFVDAKYLGDYPNGILIELSFRKGFGAKYANSYKMFVNWQSIYNGNVKIKDSFGNDLRAERVTE
jgi:hypothetical protein